MERKSTKKKLSSSGWFGKLRNLIGKICRKEDLMVLGFVFCAGGIRKITGIFSMTALSPEGSYIIFV